MPFEQWGLERPGKVHYLPDFTGDSADDINKILSDLSTDVLYECHKFSPFISNVGKTQAEFMNKLCDVFSNRIDRNTYSDKVENTLSHIFDKLLNSTDEELEMLASTFADNILDDLGIDTDGDISKGIITLVLGLMNSDSLVIERICDAIGKNLVESQFIEIYDAETRDALNTIISVVLYTGDGVSFIPYIVT